MELAVGVVIFGRDAPHPTGRLVASVLALGVLGTGVAYLMFVGLIARIGPTRASTVTYLVPLVAVTLGVVVLGEPLSVSTLVGGAVLLAGVGLASRLPPAASNVSVAGPHPRELVAGVRPQPD